MAGPNNLNPNQNRQQPKKKKNSGGAWGLIVLAVIWIINRIDFDDLGRVFSRLRRSFRTGNFNLNDRAFVTAAAVVVALVVLIVAVVAIAKRAKEKRFDGVRAKSGGTAAAHSHDRLQGYAGNESGFEHWKKQLDGFLEAGIIDRSEYRALIERRRR